MSAVRFDLTLDCADPGRLAAFWKLALGYVDEPAPAPHRSRAEWLAALGVPEDEWDGGAWLCDPEGVGPRLTLLRVPEGKVAKNRLHLDLRVDAVAATVATLVAAGATVVAEVPGHHVVLADPEGNELCVAGVR